MCVQEGPDFFVVGAPKTATTSLHHYLSQHPDLFVPSIKEPHYFSWPEVADTYYRTTFVTTEPAYRALYEPCPAESVSGDFSTSYLFSQTAAARIHAHRPDARIIISLRDPVERAVSHYRMDLRDGYTSASLGSLVDASAPDPRFRREYIDVGRYAHQIVRYTDRFPPEHVHFILFDDLMLDPKREVRRLLRFLGVDEHQEIDVSGKRNTAGRPRSPVAARMIRSTVAHRVVSVLPERPRSILRRSLLRPETAAPSADLHEALADEFVGEIDVLEEMLGRDLGAWRR